MSKHNRSVYFKVGAIVVLLGVLLCVAVFIYGRQTAVDKEEETTLHSIMTRDQIYLVCLPHTRSKDYDYALEKWQEMNYSEAYQAFMTLKEAEEKHSGKGSYEAAAINHALGCLCLDIGKYEKAYEFLNSAFVTMTDLYGESDTAALAVLSSIVYYDYVTGELEQCLKDARKICDTTPPLAIWAVTNRVQMLVHYDCGEATMSIREAYFIIDDYMKEQDETFTWDDMLSLQEYLSHQEKGELDVFSYRLLALLSWDIGNGYASTTSGKNEGEKAKKWFETSLFICQNMLDEDVPGLSAQIMADHAYLLGKCNEVEAGFSMLEQALNEQESLGGGDNICPDLVKTYTTYGEMLLYLSGDEKNALVYYEKAQELSESLHGLYSKKTAQTYYYLGKYYATLKEYGKSLEYLKQCEEIKKNTLLLKDRDAINLYSYLAVVYTSQGKLDLVKEYKQRATEVADYLKVHILSPDDKTDTTESADNAPQKESFDLSQYKEGAKWQTAIDAYTNAVQACDGNALMDALQMEFAKLIPVIAATQRGVQVDMDEIIALYTDFYQNELLLQKDELTDRFGEGYRIRFEPYAVEYGADHDINAFNDYLFKLFDSEIVLKDMVVITGQFFVSGSTNAEEQEATGHMLCQALTLLNVNGEWKLGISDGFPQLPKETLEDVLGNSPSSTEGSEKNDG